MDNKTVKKLQKSFLEALIEKNGQWSWTLEGLDRKLNQSREIVVHIAHLLEGEKKIEVRGQETKTNILYEVTSIGRQEFDPWYKKMWKFFTDDFAKIVSIIAGLLSIISIIIAITANR
ncbi:MAG: hypothetical protein WC618_05740 [Patescibacteria group bacterium]